MRLRMLVLPALVLAFAACASTGAKPLGSAAAALEAKSGSKVTGKAVFTRIEGDWLHLRIDIAGATPGLHAVHIHEKGDCSAADAATAGGHWNPWKKKHGAWMQVDGEFHLGDLGNIEVGADGMGAFEVTTDQFDMGCNCEKDVVGRSVVVHEKADDLRTDPTGNAGSRIACGPIKAARK